MSVTKCDKNCRSLIFTMKYQLIYIFTVLLFDAVAMSDVNNVCVCWDVMGGVRGLKGGSPKIKKKNCIIHSNTNRLKNSLLQQA